MMIPWFLLFFLTPVIEMYLLIRVGGWIGAFPTITLVMLTAVSGIALLRRQGFSTLMRSRQKLATGELPAAEIAEGILLGIAGALMITPGFITDLTGFALLVPAFRSLLAHKLLAQAVMFKPPGAQRSHAPGAGDTLEGEFVRRP